MVENMVLPNSLQGQGHDHTTAETVGTEHGEAVPAIQKSPTNQFIGSGIDVAEAEASFVAMQRRFSRVSRETFDPKTEPNRDLEKNSSVSVEEWDLEGVLRGRREEEVEAGIPYKQIGVLWKGLGVHGMGGVRHEVPTFVQACLSPFFVFLAAARWFSSSKRAGEFPILQDFRGLAKPGEMVLVLGKPGSGCTTFLKLMANQRFGYTKVEGEVSYGPYDAEEFGKFFRGEAVYNAEDDIHIPTLTVGQTLGFAMDTKVPGHLPAGITKDMFKAQVTEQLLKMFNIEHTKDTLVGNAFVRGISGGERKRVSVAEMMITAATVCGWDNTTRGLDASTALDFAKTLRIMTNIYKTTTFVSLYQASESIYNQFDKVLVINEGRQAFFGPIAAARAYFEDLGFKAKPRDTTPDYLTGCTAQFEREYKDGPQGENAPRTPEDFAKAFTASKYGHDLLAEIDEYSRELNGQKEMYEHFKTANRLAKRNHTEKTSVYTIPFHLQVWALVKRQFILRWQDRFSLTVSWVTSMIVAVLLGTLWLRVPKTSSGAFSRGGVLFMALLFNAFQAFGELANAMIGRPIINKHRAYAFYRPAALWMAQILVDLAFASVQIIAFSVVVYFSCGLALTAGAFFTFILTIITVYLAMTLFFRTIGCVCPDFDFAIQFVAGIVTLFVLTSGYLIEYSAQQKWLRWLFWVNSLGLGFSTLMMNEFKHTNLTCESDYLVPSGQGYVDLANQVCTLSGSKAGSDQVTGRDYIISAFSYNPVDLWRNFGIVIALVFVFLGLNAFLGELVKWEMAGKTITFFAKETKELNQLNNKLYRKKESRSVSESSSHNSAFKVNSTAKLTWEELCYDVRAPGGQKRVLKDIFGYVEPGQLVALMGASGAGKTTLLDVLTTRKNVGVVSGSILVNGKSPNKAFQRGTAYAEQLDQHLPSQTVREALRFSAELRQPYNIPRSEKFAYVEHVISLLEMEDIADAIIGVPEVGLSVEQRKCVTIGVELAAKPEVLLFLDEPTSGLDSQSAFNIVYYLQKLARAGQAIICTVHQPNSTLFESFDRLLLLHKGECIYFGDIGKDSSILLNYFRRNGAKCPIDANPAEWMLDTIGAGLSPALGDLDWAERWRTSSDFSDVKDKIASLKIAETKEAGLTAIDETEYATPLIHQIRVVSSRAHLDFFRSPNYGFTRLSIHLIVALITGFTYFQLSDSRSSLQSRVFVIFQFTVLPAFILAQVEPKYDMARQIFYRENLAKSYSQFAFAVSMVLAELPYSILCAVCFFFPLHYLTGFNNEFAGYQFLMVLITELFSVTAGQMIAALTPNAFIAQLVNPAVVIVFTLFCGITIRKPDIPVFWRSWIYYLDPFTHLLGGMIVTELHDRPVHCTADEINSFVPPLGQSCGEYMEAFFARGGAGYLVSNASLTDCQYCAYKVGDQYFEQFGYLFSGRWKDLGIYAIFIISNLLLLFLGSYYLKFHHR
ncbi:hypothetical protein V491_02293 [Pseudogymnoascus sp. VKM F-3775]|nr:hypothetical protein V491_02293 [Pseudogymnoascus sp. VKM F-3775]